MVANSSEGKEKKKGAFQVSRLFWIPEHAIAISEQSLGQTRGELP